MQVAVFEGACYTTPLIGAVFADSMWGRYKTILVFSIIYLVVSDKPTGNLEGGKWPFSHFGQRDAA